MKTLILLAVLLFLLLAVVFAGVRNRVMWTGQKDLFPRSFAESPPVTKEVDLQPVAGIQPIPRYLDLNVGDSLRVRKTDGEVLEMRVASISVEKRSLSSPRTRVHFESGDQGFSAACGMEDPSRGGIGPTVFDGVGIAVEITSLLFSANKGGSSPFLTYENFTLQGDLRLAVWDATQGLMPGVDGRFVVDQPSWSRNRFGPWLHSTSYGLHAATDIFATKGPEQEPVRSPVGGTVYRVYNQDASPDDDSRSKAINIYGNQEVGPDGERMLFRFQHFSQILVETGDEVTAGQVIGLTGHTGFDPGIGDHLHFEIRLNPSHFGLPFDDDLFATIPVNPYPFLLEWYQNEGRVGR